MRIKYENEVRTNEKTVPCVKNSNIPYMNTFVEEKIGEMLVRDKEIPPDSQVIIPEGAIGELNLLTIHNMGYESGYFVVFRNEEIIYEGNFHVSFKTDFDEINLCNTILTITKVSVSVLG